MEKYKIKIAGAALFFVILALTGCKGGSGTSNTGDSDSVKTMADETPAQETVYYLTSEGIASDGEDFVIKTGTPMDEIPERAEGLYSSISKESTPEYEIYTFTLDEEGMRKETFRVYDFGEGKADMIQLADATVKVRTPKGDVHIGQSFLDVLNIPDVQATWEGYDYEASGTWYWTWEGLFFQPSHSRLSDTLLRKMYSDGEAPVAEDFTAETETESISTGLPF